MNHTNQRLMKTKALILFLPAIVLTAFTINTPPSGKHAMKVLKGFTSEIPAGVVILDEEETFVESFWIQQTEVTNLQYLEFLHHLEKNGMTEELAIAEVQGDLWNAQTAYGEPMSVHYHVHPAYHNYPVVNITREAAELYCKWLSSAYDSISGGELQVEFRLPSRAEWVRAARGNNLTASYSWGGPYLRNTKGCFLANCLNYGAGHITRNPDTHELEVVQVRSHTPNDDQSTLTAPVDSYVQSEFGLYCMNGNVSEMVADEDLVVGGDWNSPGYDIRIESARRYEGAQPTVGFRVAATIRW